MYKCEGIWVHIQRYSYKLYTQTQFSNLLAFIFLYLIQQIITLVVVFLNLNILLVLRITHIAGILKVEREEGEEKVIFEIATK